MEVLNLKEKYPFTCLCGHKEPAVAPSLFMQTFQLNVGRVYCPSCETGISVKINDANDQLDAVAVIEQQPLPDACYKTVEK